MKNQKVFATIGGCIFMNFQGRQRTRDSINVLNAIDMILQWETKETNDHT